MGSRVVVTGIGLVTPLGATARDTFAAWRNGQTASTQPVPELAGTPLATAPVAVLPPLHEAERLGGRRMLKYMSDAALLGCLAAREALQEARVTERFAAERVGLYAGTGLAAANLTEVQRLLAESVDADGQLSLALLGARGLAATNPLLSFKILPNMPSCLISVMETIKGPNLVFTPWEGQTAAALIEGWQAVADGAVDCALVGGADSAAHPATLVYLRQAGLLGADEYPASAAGYLVLERAATAERDQVSGHAAIRQLTLTPDAGGVRDPLAARLGRTFAAAPPILLGLACLGAMPECSRTNSTSDVPAAYGVRGKRSAAPLWPGRGAPVPPGGEPRAAMERGGQAVHGDRDPVSAGPPAGRPPGRAGARPSQVPAPPGAKCGSRPPVGDAPWAALPPHSIFRPDVACRGLAFSLCGVDQQRFDFVVEARP